MLLAECVKARLVQVAASNNYHTYAKCQGQDYHRHKLQRTVPLQTQSTKIRNNKISISASWSGTLGLQPSLTQVALIPGLDLVGVGRGCSCMLLLPPALVPLMLLMLLLVALIFTPYMCGSSDLSSWRMGDDCHSLQLALVALFIHVVVPTTSMQLAQ